MLYSILLGFDGMIIGKDDRDVQLPHGGSSMSRGVNILAGSVHLCLFSVAQSKANTPDKRNRAEREREGKKTEKIPTTSRASDAATPDETKDRPTSKGIGPRRDPALSPREAQHIFMLPV